MLGKIIGKNNSAHLLGNLQVHKSEYRLKSLRGQDRSVTPLIGYARTTDNRNPLRIDIQSELPTINKIGDNISWDLLSSSSE